MIDADFAIIEARLAHRAQRVAVVPTSAGLVVVKAQRPARSAWRRRAFNAVALMLGVGFMQVPPERGGAAGQETEVRRLGALRQAGLRVPAVLHVDSGFFVMEHIAGPSLVRTIEQGGDAGFAAWRSGLAALVDAHRRGGCLSFAFARNFIVADDGLAMVDFEDDPLAVMSLEQAQSRDWLAYLHSTLWLLDRPAADVGGAIAGHLLGENAAVRALVVAAGERLAALRHLPRSRRPWGREVAGLAALARAFPLPTLRAGRR